MKRFVLSAIRLYQRLLSRTGGPLDFFLGRRGFCRFTPTCSEYTHEAVKRYGIIRGLYLGARRILRCHPFGKSGFDPAP